MAANSNAQNPDEIRREIEAARAQMRQTIGTLQVKLDPQRIKQQAAESVREATIGRVEEFAGNAGRTVKGASDDVIETIKQNPLPAALAAIGIGWLFMESRNQNRSFRQQRYTPRQGYYGYAEEYPYNVEGRRSATGRIGERAGDIAGQTQEKASEVAGRVGERASEMASDVQEKAGEIAEGARERAEQFSGQVQQTAHKAKSSLANLMDENPMLVGAAAVALGALVGMSLPQTQKEHEMFGSVRDDLVDKAQTTAQETMHKAQSVVQEAGSAAKEAAKSEAEKQGLSQQK